MSNKIPLQQLIQSARQLVNKKKSVLFFFPLITLLILSFQNCSKGFNADNLENVTKENTSNIPNNDTDSTNTSTSGGCNTSSGIAKNFPCSLYFNQSVDQITLNQTQKNYSDHLINGLVARGGWGNKNIFQVDTSIDVLEVPTNNKYFYNVNPNDDWTDADSFTQVPAPAPGSTAGFEGGENDCASDGDCHYLALDKANKKLYEFYRAKVNGNNLTNAGYGGAVIWPFDKVWTESLRGDVCTSADAGGFSIGGMLFSAEEIQAGSINHAIRLILPNNRIAYRTYVRPATHTTGNSQQPDQWAPAPTSDLTDSPLANSALEPGIPYGTRLRLKASFNISTLSSSAQVVAKALKKYGMILADGGEIALTAKSDANSSVKYENLGFINNKSLTSLKVTDFEVVPPIQPKPFASGLSFQPTVIGPMIKVKYLDCYKN